MSRHHEQLLRRICQNEPTFSKAKTILHTASLKTTPGSGYELGQGATGLPAICAYIAAEELGDDDIDEKSAQAASCLKPKVFKTTLQTVRSALAAAAAAATSPTKRASRNISYKQLVDDAKIGRKGMVTEWMKDAERTLMDNREMRRRFQSAYDAITLAVFCWVCGLMGNKKVKAPDLLDKYDVPRDQFDELTDALHEVCKDVAKDIQNDIAALKAGTYVPKTRPTTVTVSPTKGSAATLPPPIAPPARSLSRSPSKSALRAPSLGLTPTKTPSHKRKVAFDDPIPEEDEEEFDVTATPSKRQKLSSPVKPLPPTPAPATARASSRLADVATARAAREAEEAFRAHEQPVAGPSTPRRARTAPSQPPSTHSSRSGRSRSQTGSAPTTPSRHGKARMSTVREELGGGDRPARRRCRPVFADQQQWLRGDSRLERELKPWMKKWRELVQRAGGDVWKAAGMVGEGAAATVRVAA
ncbi:hypothetical protein BD309DRAFT_1000465 [Dichomitus squalens]|uniref:Uncharacterized protein n=1 Tax=Dichomitus squalens TaxID=114155 RepID=A0A4Q9MIG8_9APHY|nr:hypothetical protein BD311DRAFT_789318 [Dichomitus squalens]TBU44456.1 hypothetical protein BD309DRAFT_1000465 [Dichomitus squalens]